MGVKLGWKISCKIDHFYRQNSGCMKAELPSTPAVIAKPHQIHTLVEVQLYYYAWLYWAATSCSHNQERLTLYRADWP